LSVKYGTKIDENKKIAADSHAFLPDDPRLDSSDLMVEQITRSGIGTLSIL
jgi:hypothetical protein